MRTPFIAGNWKMNTLKSEAVALAKGVAEAVGSVEGVEVAVCPPFAYLDAVAQALAGSTVGLGGQNMYFEKSGAYTAEVSGPMLKDLGCKYVILGHSERRHVFGEADDLVGKKTRAALENGLEVILCVGELIEQRKAGRTTEVVERQLSTGLTGLSAADMARVTVAYEPVWAIGTGETATPDQAQEVHALSLIHI